MIDDAPPILTEVAFGRERVALLMVVVPDEAPIFKEVAAPAKLIVVAVVFQRFWVVCVPTTVGLPMVKVPEFAPILRVVAAPKALMVVAVVLRIEKEVEPVVMLVVNDGEVLKTRLPVPVSSVTEAATLAEEIEVVRLDEPSVVTNLLAVNPEKVIVPDAVRLTASVIDALLMDRPLMVSVVEAVIVPLLTIEPLLVILKILVGVAELEATKIS